MADSQAYRFLWSVGIVAVLLPHLYSGLLSDYKICGDSACESSMSRVQAIRDHQGKDCRYLSFRRGDTIFVYHKLTGKRDDLWAGSIDKQFGYFPKDAVREEHLYATVERVVETQKSDFFCMDEYGYPIDSSHLDSDEDEDDDRLQNQDPEKTQTAPDLDEKNTESPSTPEVVSTESQGSSADTQEELDKNSNADDDAAAGTQEEAQQDPASSKEQGGSASSPWLGSTVTGWLGLAEEEESANVAEGEEKGEGEETQADASSLASSLTGWLGMGEGGGDSDDGVESGKEEEAESFSSSVTGWLGFGGEQENENENPAEKEDVNEKKGQQDRQEQAETFRSRRMSLDLEGSQLHNEEKETGTLGWLGNGLSSTLGFGQGNQESETTERESKETVKEEESGSWYDMGMGTIFGFNKDTSEESTESSSQEADAAKIEDPPMGSESLDADQSQNEDLTTKTNDELDVEVTPQDENIPSETDTVPSTADPKSAHEGASESIDESVEAVEETSLKLDTLVQTEDKEQDKVTILDEDETENNVLDLGTADLEGKDDLTSEAIKNKGDNNDIGEIETADESDQDILTQQDINNVSDFTSVDFISDSEGGSVVGVEENPVQESTKIQSETYDGDGDDHKGGMNNQETDGLREREISEAETDGSVEQSQMGAENSSVEIHDPNSNEHETLSQLEYNAHQDSVSSGKQERVSQSDTDAQEQRETVIDSEKYVENNLSTSTVDSELETEKDEESEEKKEEKGVEELKTEEKLVERAEIEVQEKQQVDEEEQDKVREEKEEEKQKTVNEITEKGELLESEEEEVITGKEKQLEQEKLKEEKTQELKESEEGVELGKVEEKQLVEGIERVEQKEGEEFNEGVHIEFKELKEEDEEEKRDQVPSLGVEQDLGNNDGPESESKETETQDEDGLETSNQSEYPQIEGNKDGELIDEVEDVEEKDEGERRDREEESEDATDRYEKDSVVDSVSDMTEGMYHLNVSSENKKDEGRTQEERVREEERREESEEVDSVQANKVSDAVGVDSTEEMKYTNNDLPHLAEDIQGELSREVLSSQTAEDERNNQVKSTKLISDKENNQGDETDAENSSRGISTEEITETEKTNDGYVWEEGKLNMKDDHERVNEDGGVMMTISYQNTSGTEITTEEASESQTVVSDQTVPQHSLASSLPPQGPDNKEVKTEGGSAFGLFKNAFNLFGQTPATETEESPESPESLDSPTHETPDVQTSLTPEQQPDTPADSSQVYIQASHSDTPLPLSEEQLHPSPSPSWTPESYPTGASPHMESPLHMKTLSKQFRNLHTFLSTEDSVMLGDLFGQHKLQFLDDILGSQETMTGDPDTDESILMDVEMLLNHHREMLTTPHVKLSDAPQEEKGKTRMLIALEKLEMLLAKVRETFSTGKPDSSNTNHQAESDCVGESCSTPSEDTETAAETESHKAADTWMGLDQENDGKLSGETDKQSVTEDEVKERASLESNPHFQPQPSQMLEGLLQENLGFVHMIVEESSIHIHAARELLIWLTVQVVSALPDDIRPGPDLYGVPWEPVIFSSLLGLVIMLLFTCRCYSSVKSRLYRSKERWMADEVAQLLDEKCKVLETLSKCQQEYDDLETSLTDRGILAQIQKTEQLEVKARQLGQNKKELERDLKQLKDQVDQQREHRKEQERRIASLEESMKTCEEETKDLQSQEEQAQTTVKVYNMNSERLQRNLETAGEENNLLQDSNSQLRQQVEGWAERVGELEAEISRCEVSHSGMLQDVANKDERIWSLTDRLLRMKAWDSDLKEEGGEEEEKETSNGTAMKGDKNGRGDRTDSQGHLQKVQKLIYAAKLNADLKSVDEDKDRAFAKLNDEIKAKEDLQVSIKEMENEKLSLQSDTENFSDQVQKLQQKLHIMTEMYQDNELKLHRLLTVEEKDRMQKEERLNKADKNIALALEELNNYRQRAAEMEEELEKTKQSYQTQISAHEKKAHNNWLAARAAERDLSDIRRENALLRQKLTDTQFKLDTLDKDPYALDSLARPLPFRAERSPYGPSPLGRPASETRPFLSPPTLMDGPPARLSPRVPRGPMEHLGGPGEMERTGGPHSDSGSISPSWERDRRGPPPGPPGPLGPQGYMFPEPGGPVYRRPLPPPGAMGPLPPGPFPPGPLPPRGLPPGPFHPADMADGSFRENSFGSGEQDHRESGPADRRISSEADPRIGGPHPPGPPMGPMDGPFPRRAPFGPPPQDFYPPRGPGGPPIRPMWAPPPPGMMLPPRFPPGGPLPPHPHQVPPIRHPFPDGLPPPSMGPPPPRQPLPSPPHSQSPEEHTPSPEDAI